MRRTGCGSSAYSKRRSVPWNRTEYQSESKGEAVKNSNHPSSPIADGTRSGSSLDVAVSIVEEVRAESTGGRVTDSIHPSSRLGEGTRCGYHVVIEANAQIGRN